MSGFKELTRGSFTERSFAFLVFVLSRFFSVDIVSDIIIPFRLATVRHHVVHRLAGRIQGRRADLVRTLALVKAHL